MWRDKNTRKEHLKEKNCQGDLWQENYLDSQIKDMTKNTGEDWKETGDDKKENDERKEEPWNW